VPKFIKIGQRFTKLLPFWLVQMYNCHLLSTVAAAMLEICYVVTV